MAHISLDFHEASFLRLCLLLAMRDYSHSIDLDKSLLSTAPPDMVGSYTEFLKSDLKDYE